MNGKLTSNDATISASSQLTEPTVVNVITDFVCAILPVFVLKPLQMRLRIKIELGLLLGVAIL